MLFTHVLQFLLHGDAITINPILPDHYIVQVGVGITQPHDLRHLLHRCYELLDLAHDPTVILRIVPADADKQIEEISIACTQTQRIPNSAIADSGFLDDDLGLWLEADAEADVDNAYQWLCGRVGEVEDVG